jgi:hypothetical protein
MEIPVEFVFANMDGLVLNYQGDGANVMLHSGDVWFADDPFVLRRPELFSTTPPVAFSTVGRQAPPATPLAVPAPAVDAPKVRRARA